MSVELHSGHRERPRLRNRMPRHASLAILLLAAVALLALCGRSASAQATSRVEESVKKALALEPNAAEGGHLYSKHCMSCHRRHAKGDVTSVTPALAGQVSSYVIKQLADLVEGYRELPEMHRQLARTELANPQAMRDLSAYLTGLQPIAEPEVGDGKQLRLGSRIYRTVCAQCHGMRGEGAEVDRVPALRGQHYSYVLRQARQLSSGHREGVDLGVLALLDALSLDQLAAVADYISRLPASSDAEAVAAAVSSRTSWRVSED